MTNQFNKFKLLMWKNWTLLKRRPIHTAFEIIYPVLICLVLVGVRSMIHVEEEDSVTYLEFEATNVGYQFCRQKDLLVAYSPPSTLLQEILSSTFMELCQNSSLLIQSYANSETLNELINNDVNLAKNLFAAIQFNDDLSGLTDQKNLASNVKITIRLPTMIEDDKNEWYTNLIYPVFQTPGPRSEGYSNYGGTPDYMKRGFLALQQKLTLALLGTPVASEILMQRFPYPAYLNDLFYADMMETMVGLMLMMSFMYNFINTIRAITTEKEHQLKESMKIMGLPGWLHWMAWFLRSFIILLIAIIIIVVVLTVTIKTAPVFTYSEPSVLFIFLFIFSCSTITFSFFISVFFSKSNTATAVGSLVFFLTYLPYTLQQQSTTVNVSAVLASSLLANSGLSFGVGVILKFEAVQEGIQWNNLWSSTSPDNDLTLGAILLIMLFDTFFYLCLALYIEAVFPGEYGVPQPWYFPFTRAYWCNKAVHLTNDDKITKNTGEYFEDFNENLPIGIQLQNLSKIFGANTAVNKLNLDMYEGQITVLLGHNGAGKTTTMSMITGMFPPTKGTAMVSGYDVRTNVQSVRDSMGLCLQHNVLFDSLTVYEHLYFFGKLKGLQANEIEQEINNYISLLELEDKRHALSSSLSGGMKRKLSVGMAMCGNSKVVMLDEPTAGMDPSARRAIWNLLQKQKEGRTILLTTHFMDEADLLGDRIAIMTGGVLQCCGSSFFLKKKYGAGYYLIMDIKPNCATNEITRLLKKYIPQVEIFSHVGSELTYQLPENESGKFERMLHELEQNVSRLGVQSYGMSLTTLEEVFMKVGADHENNSSKMYNNSSNTNGNDSTILVHDNSGLQTLFLRGGALMRNQFIAMILKKILSIWRTWYLMAIQILLPIALLIITVLNARQNLALTQFPALEISLDSYRNPVMLIDGNGQYYDLYKDMLSNYQVNEVPNVADAILTETVNSPANVKMHYIVGASFNATTSKAWFNGDPYHSTPLALNLVLNMLYKQTLGKDFSISFTNHPLPLTLDAQLDNLQFNIMGFQIAMELGYGMAFVASFYILFCIRERISKAKHLQFVSGVNVFVFWGAAFLCDLFTYLITMCGILITLAGLQEEGFSTPDELSRLTVVLVYFGFFMLPFTYLASYLFGIPSTGFSRMMLLGAVAGIVGITAMQVLEIEALDLLYVARPLNWVLLFIPFYSIAKGAYDLGSITSYRKICSQISEDLNIACAFQSTCCGLDDYYAMTSPGIGRNVIISFVMFFVLFAVIIFNEYGFFSFIMNKLINYNKPPSRDIQLEVDVQEENNKIHNTDPYDLSNEYCLVLRDVTKYYKNFLAVNGLCLGVKPYECFGLLGVNGAGKTTTFKMMTGDEQISYGEAWVNGLNIKREQKKVQRLIGYCPQFDALLDDLTARETLRIFGLIRGVPMENCNQLGEHLAHEFDFFKHLDKKIKELSGGNKRKLSTALALIGDPPIIYLDEPTTGMDPATKRFLWTALAKLRDNGKCIILTSHSMEECEALCTRLAIMVNGNFQCLGSTQRLKNKFAQGYALTIKMRKTVDHNIDNEITMIDNFIRANFPGAELKEKYQELLSYQLINNSMPWSQMFGLLERSKKELNIEDYSLGQCSLEQVFLSFTKYQQ